jgi:hypothetical protein
LPDFCRLFVKLLKLTNVTYKSETVAILLRSNTKFTNTRSDVRPTMLNLTIGLGIAQAVAFHHGDLGSIHGDFM